MSIIYINSYQFAAAPPSGYDPDAAAYIARVEGASGDNLALETAVKDAINDFVVGCKADGIWSAIKASCILAGARTLSGALQPLVGTAPTNPGSVFVSSDYNRKTGLLGDGTTKQLDTNRSGTADPTNNRHASVYASSPVSTNNRGILGTATNGSTTEMRVLGSPYRVQFACSSLLSSGPAPAYSNQPSLIGVSRNNSSSFDYRIDGASATASVASSTPFAGNIFVFSRANALYYPGGLAFYSLGEAIDLAKLDARVTTLINAFAAAIP